MNKVPILAAAPRPQQSYWFALKLIILSLFVLCVSQMSYAIDIPGLYNPAPDEAVIYYKRTDSQYDGWGLHLWDPDDGRVNYPDEVITSTEWGTPLLAEGISDLYGAYYVVQMNAADWHDFMFIMHKGNEKDLGGGDHIFFRTELGEDAFSFQGVANLFSDPILEPPVAVEGANAHWINKTTILVNADSAAESRLHYSADADLILDQDTKQIIGGDEIILNSAMMPEGLDARFISKQAFTLSLTDDDLRDLLTHQLIVANYNAEGKVINASKVQLPGVLDELYASAETAKLGATLSRRNTKFKLWAPTAQSVSLELYWPGYFAEKRKIVTLNMRKNNETGVWGKHIRLPLPGYYYRYKVTVYHPETDMLETYSVTDPYSLSLSANSQYSQVIDLNSWYTKPWSWNSAKDYVVENPEDIVIYETHIRDISVSDQRGRDFFNGKYMAFTEGQRSSMRHLDDLASAGLTHLHLLPAFDIATIDENVSQRVELQSDFGDLCDASDFATTNYASYCDSGLTVGDVLATLDPSTGDVQELNEELLQLDAYNWGYDPYHYTVPEGSYASNPEGMTRVREFRSMVQSLHNKNLNVVMDVVYNHTNAAGLAEKSVLDKVVPGYYHRLNTESGSVETSTCCQNTATENMMMEKLMIDSLVTWAKDYQVDAFRFDLMGHHMKTNMEKALAAVQAVRPHVYFYGEGWNFGEVADGARGENAIQWNMGGTGIGTFTDRLRDAVRGGGPFDSEDALRRTQGFANGLYTLPNEMNNGSDAEKDELLALSDLIRIGMAGNLQEFLIVDRNGATARGQDVDYNGAKAGYTLDPQETINYVSKHDNQSLWDNNQYKIARGTPAETRVRMHNIALSIPLLSQGLPFIHMGSDLLRSKSFMRDSYDSGDWYNRVDFDGYSNNWNVGLPKFSIDGSNWPVIEPIIADYTTQVSPIDINNARWVFQEILAVRSASPLFKLTNSTDVQNRVDFKNTGADQIPGVIVMTLDDGNQVSDLDTQVDGLVVVINATPDAVTVSDQNFVGLQLFGPLSQSVDPMQYTVSVTGNQVTVPAFTTTVLAIPQLGAQGIGLPVSEKDLSNIPAYGATTVYAMGSFNDWGTDNAFSFEGDNTYAMTVNFSAGDFELKIASADESTVNFGGDIDLFDTGEAVLMADAINIRLHISTPQTLRLSLNVADSENPLLTVASADVAPWGSTTVFMRGSMNEWGTDSPFNYWGDGLYSLHRNIEAGSYVFKVAEESWATVNLGSNNGLLIPDTSVTLVTGEGDIGLDIPASGAYSLILDANDSTAPVLALTADAPYYGATAVYIRGSLNGWGTADVMTYVGEQKYQVTRLVSAGAYDFKVSSEDWSTVNWGAETGIDQQGSVWGVNGGNNITLQLDTDTELTFTLDMTQPTSPKITLQ